ncbi:hypothetical protein JRQ81_005312 [Phrynocephalus forsythii]|uniref:Doublecortin domain-containing protein n=1 Tax=Phrynocephalus forsythii TaxID=171643 RepID=A0A9Q1B646_9SAUR|nr:hypothetical protein JRQ81_005312 [Phrynocephalus forsythii]
MTQPPADFLSSSSPYNYEQTLPPLARANGVTQVAPAKKITFYKSGDPQFGGVKMAINQRTFKSFNALMDDLSHRVPLPFGVRTITTPRGIHCISTLDQLEDGGCYLCSDKKYTTPMSIGATSRKTGPPKNSQPAGALRRAAPDAKPEDTSAHGTPQGTKLPKKITLVRNGDVTAQHPFVLSRKNARSFRTLLDEISEIMQYTVKKLYTLDGKKIDNLQTVLLCPNVLICVGQESFKPLMREQPRKQSSLEKLPGLTSHSSSNNLMDFGLKAKKSVIHPRSSLSNRSARLSLSSEKSYPNGLGSSENGAPSVHSYVRSKGGDLVHDDIEKSVHMNKDGSLSVEMKVRFRLINDETLQWSTQIKKSSLMNRALCEELAVSEDNRGETTENPEASSEMDDSLYPCDADSYVSNLEESEIEEARCHNCGKLCKPYDIWKNPMHAGPKEDPGARNTWHTHSSCSSTSSRRRIVREKVASVDSIRTSSSGDEYTKHIVHESSHYTETVQNTVEYHSVKTCSSPCDCLQANLRQNGTPGEREAIGTSANSENEEDGIVVGGEAPEESKGSRPGSTKSRTSRCSAESQIEICEEACSVARTISSSSIKEREDVMDSSSSPHSFCSQSSKCSNPGRPKDQGDEVSENDHAITSFSTDSCPKNDAAEGDVERDEEEINEAYSVSEKATSDPPAKDDASESDRCSSGRSFYSRSCDGNSRRSDSNEAPACSAASTSSRRSQRSKQSRNHLDTGSHVSSGSRRSSATQKKQANTSLHAEDTRSNSRASYYSRSSHEVEKRDVGGHASHDSSSPHSNVSSFSETAAPPAAYAESVSSTSRCYSRSIRSSLKGIQPDGSSCTNSPCSSFSDSGGKNEHAKAKRSSEADSSPRGNWSESTCSKCGQAAETRHDDLRSVSSRVSSLSEAKSQRAVTEASRRSDDTCSQSSMAPSSKRSRRKTRHLYPEADCSSQASASASASVYSLRCPAPPKGRPSSRNSRPVQLKKRNDSASVCTESEPAADTERKEAAGSQSVETAVTNEIGDQSDRSNKEGKFCHEEARTEAASCADDDGIIPSSLPNTSPEDVVQEWLRKIPSDTLQMKCEMQDDGEGADLDAELPSCCNNRESSRGGSEEKKEEGAKEGKEPPPPPPPAEVAGGEAEDETEEAEAVREVAKEEEPKEERSSEVVAEEEAESSQARCELAALSTQNNHRKDLPDTIQTSVQIMKALLASKQEPKMDRSHSLPEVSPTMGRKLSNSANILITCLASLQLLDEELDSSGKSNKGRRRPLYTELLNIFQALWFGCTSEKDAACSGLQEEDQAKVALSDKSRKLKDGDFTPMSSSGVDVGSGDGGSGEGSVAGAQDRALSPEKMDEAKPAEGEEGEAAANTGEGADHNEGEELCSRALTPCSTSEAGRKVVSDGGEGEDGAGECQGSHCETEQEEENEMAGEEEGGGGSKQDENTECDETVTDAETVQEETEDGTVVTEGEDDPTPEKGKAAPEEPSIHEAEAEPAASEGKGEEEPAEDGATELADEPNAEAEPSNVVTHQPLEEAAPLVQQQSIAPDPTWVLRLLKKIKKEFMTHYATAMNELKVKWNLPDSEEVNMMISEVKDEVSKRIQRSIEKELMKIRSRAGQRVPRPPDQMQQESTLQVENRRRHLQSIHKMSLYNDRNGNQSKQLEVRDLSAEIDDDSLFSTIRDDDSDQPSEEEYCPCDACIRKKLVARATRPPPVVASNAPVVKAFDLQQILRMNKPGPPKKSLEDEIAEEGQDEDSRPAAGEAAELESNQEMEEGKEAGDSNEQEGQEVVAEQVVAEDEAGTLKEDLAGNENSKEAGRESAANEEVEEEAKEEVREDEEKEGKEAMKGEEEVQEGKEEEEGDAEEEKEKEAAMEEGEEEEVIQKEKKEEEKEDGVEEEKEEEAAMEEGEEVIQKEEKQEGGVEEGKEEEEEAAMEEGEEETAMEEGEKEEEEEGGVEEEKKEEEEEEEAAIEEGEEEEVTQKEEKEEVGAEGEKEEELKQGKEEDVDVEEEEKEEEEEAGKLEEDEQGHDQENTAQLAEEDKEMEEEEGKVKGEKVEEDKTKEKEEGKEGQPVKEKEEKEEVKDEMEEGKEEGEEQGGGEGDHEEDNEEEEAKDEGEEERNEKKKKKKKRKAWMKAKRKDRKKRVRKQPKGKMKRRAPQWVQTLSKLKPKERVKGMCLNVQEMWTVLRVQEQKLQKERVTLKEKLRPAMGETRLAQMQVASLAQKRQEWKMRVKMGLWVKLTLGQKEQEKKKRVANLNRPALEKKKIPQQLQQQQKKKRKRKKTKSMESCKPSEKGPQSPAWGTSHSSPRKDLRMPTMAKSVGKKRMQPVARMERPKTVQTALSPLPGLDGSSPRSVPCIFRVLKADVETLIGVLPCPNLTPNADKNCFLTRSSTGSASVTCG